MKNIKRLMGIGLSLSLVMTGCTRINAKSTSNKSYSQLKDTIVTSQMDEKIATGKNLVYCSTFQLAWNELKNNVIKEDIKLADEPSIVPLLNKEISTKKDISDKDYVAMVGFIKDNILDKINMELKNKFGSEAPKVEANLGPDDIIAYAYLNKNLKFKDEFEKLKKPISFKANNSTIQVNGFGIESTNNERRNEIANQVRIVDYKNDDNFIVKLLTETDKDELILAKVEADATLLSTVNAVSKRTENCAEETFGKKDILCIPSMDFYINHSYEELINKTVMNKKFKDYKVSKAMQDIRFKLDEKGAQLKSQAEINLTLGIHLEKSPKKFIFDKPYLIILREKGAQYPYFAMWIENPLELSGN